MNYPQIILGNIPNCKHLYDINLLLEAWPMKSLYYIEEFCDKLRK